MVICEMRKCERVFCEITCETVCDWSIGRHVFCRLPVAVVVAATGAVGAHVCSYSFITRERSTEQQKRITIGQSMYKEVKLFV